MNMTLDHSQLDQALRETGARLKCRGVKSRVRLYLVGGSAGMLSGFLSESRSTGDVDVAMVEPGSCWEAVREAAAEVAQAFDLPETWLNDDCQMFAWCLPLGWIDRCQASLAHGPLSIHLIHRQDFIAAKVVSAPRRPQDFADILAANPTPEELVFTEEHIDRLEREHLNPDHSFRDARDILRVLRGDQ
jgi:uncharacterized nucleotidyltransferase DUF6036